MTAPERCHSCGTARPAEQMRRPVDMFWRPIADLSECRDGEACWQAVLLSLRASDARATDEPAGPTQPSV